MCLSMPNVLRWVCWWALSPGGARGCGEVVSEARGARRLNGRHLVLALEIALVVFAFSYYLSATNDPNSSSGSAPGSTALYFSTARAATVGHGNAHPTGQTARAVVTLHVVCDLVFMAAVVTLASRRMSERRAARHDVPTDNPTGNLKTPRRRNVISAG
jgi:voltage-gated potassium channel